MRSYLDFEKQISDGNNLTVTGNGEQRRDFIHVDDTVKVKNWFALNPSISGIYNVGTGKPETVNTLAKLVGGNKTFSNNVIVTGDLTVNGTNTVINSTVLTVNDQHIVINDGGDDTSANGGGIILEGTSAKKTRIYDNTNKSCLLDTSDAAYE